MKTVFVGCSMLEKEIKQVMQEIGLENKMFFIDAALHVNLDRLEESLCGKLDEAIKIAKPIILVGNKCHPSINQIAQRYDSQIVTRSNCIELLLGDTMKELDREAKIFYITSGWLEKWREIFITGLGWDGIDARQNFGFYDKILLLDLGTPIDEETLLDFFEYTQIPIEPYPISLESLKKELTRLLSISQNS